MFSKNRENWCIKGPGKVRRDGTGLMSFLIQTSTIYYWPVESNLLDSLATLTADEFK